MTQTDKQAYYDEVGNYFDLFTQKMADNRDHNLIFTGMRDSFRSFAQHPSPKNILDIGCGTGEDAIFFAQKYPGAKVYGIDLSANMITCAMQNAKNLNVANVHFVKAGIESLSDHIDKSVKFDLITVFFGALNTVASLKETAAVITKQLSPGGKAMLTFVNKYYMSEFFLNIIKGRVKQATARWEKVWNGYSDKVALPSTTYSPSVIKKAFSELKLIDRKGYSIFYPAWFQLSWIKKYPKFCNFLYKLDKLANKTFFWQNGEYTLFVYQNI